MKANETHARFERKKGLFLGGLIGIAIFFAIFAVVLLSVSGVFSKQNIMTPKEAKKAVELEEQRKKAREKAREEELEQIASGAWQGFPAKKFYVKCTEYGVYNLDSAFAVQKATAVAKQLLTDNVSFPDEFIDQYCSAEKVKEYWTRGKEIADSLEAQFIAKQGELQSGPKSGQLPEAERESVSLANQLKMLFGTKKRIAMLDDAIQKINKKIYDYEEGQKALKEVAFLLGSSVAQEKKKDWAFLGGLVEGIAGPGAGIAVAANAMMENQEIERRNQIARQEAMKTVKSFYDSSFQLSNDIDDLKNEKKLMQYHRRQAQVKVVLDQYSTDEIFKSLTISSSVSKFSKGNATKLSASVRNKFVADVPDGVVVAVDGTLDAEIYFDGTLVDTVCVCLPLFGVAEGTTENVVAFSPKYVEADGKYTVKIKPNKLWVMEV